LLRKVQYRPGLLKLIRQCITENEVLWTSKHIEIFISTDGFDAENPESITVAGEKLLAYSVVFNLLKKCCRSCSEAWSSTN